MSFSYSISETDGHPVFALHGRLLEREQGEALVAAFDARLEAGQLQLLLDLSDLEYLNSSGLNLIIGMLTRARNAGGELIICGLSAKARQLMVATRLDSVFKIHGSLADALTHFNDKSTIN